MLLQRVHLHFDTGVGSSFLVGGVQVSAADDADLEGRRLGVVRQRQLNLANVGSHNQAVKCVLQQ